MDLGEFERHLVLFSRLLEQDGILPEVTFDDGHISGFEPVLPMLVERGIKAHFFVTAGWIGNKKEFMGWPELRAIHAAGQIVGAHGWSHTLLTHCDEKQLTRELKDARAKLEDEIGSSVTTMSFPGGRYNRRVLEACWEAGYSKVYSSTPRVESDPLGAVVGRLNIRRDMTLPWIEGLFQPQSKIMSSIERQARLKVAAQSILGDWLYACLWAALNRQESEAQP